MLRTQDANFTHVADAEHTWQEECMCNITLAMYVCSYTCEIAFGVKFEQEKATILNLGLYVATSYILHSLT